MEYYKDNHIAVYNKDCRSMSELTDNSIQCVVTSPPYWGLRKYAGLPDLIWGEDEGCQHVWGITKKQIVGGGVGKEDDYGIHKDRGFTYSDCFLCGAWKGQLGLEPSPEMYIQHTIEILREIRRVLRKDGIVFWNIGDSYGTGSSGMNFSGKSPNQQFRPNWDGQFQSTKPLRHSVIKPKDLCLIPFRVAIAAQEDGWWVRSVIIWNKTNPMPESVKDRPTESHEYILLLTKSSKYYWDMEAVRESSTSEYGKGVIDATQKYSKNIGNQPHSGWMGGTAGHRNLRSVWTFPTQPYPEAHFATFPEELPERCIKAGSKEGDIILDPFAGSGTTLWVAKRLNRKAIGYELSKEYCQLIIKRNRQQGLV